MTIPVEQLIPVVSAGVLALISYLVKSYFANLARQIDELKNSLQKRDGRIEQLAHEIRKNTEEQIKLRTEMHAIWRYIDNAPKRATDLGANHG